jgi:predicted enzyme related to lactoylglutathione lyase
VGAQAEEGIMAKKKKTAKKRAAPATRRAAKKSAPRKKAAPKRAAAAKTPKRAAAKKKPAGPRVHSVVHWEIQSQAPERLHRFYSDALGWEINANNPMNYGMVASRGKDGINGGIGGTEGPGSRVTVYAAVPDIPSVLDRILSLGGQVVMPRTDVGPVIMGLYTDPEGNLMGLIEG